MGKKVQITFPQDDGYHRIIGEAEIDDNGEVVSANITDPEMAHKIFGEALGGEVQEIERHNVFDKDKD